MILGIQEMIEQHDGMIQKLSLRSPYFADYIRLLSATGLRPVEALDLNCIVAINHDHIVFKPHKNNNTRVIPILDIPETFLNYYLNLSVAIQQYHYRRYLREYKHLKNYGMLFVSNKPLELYFFRYHFIKKLSMEGKTVPEITAIIGWTNEAMCERYINRIITYY